jgi:hypothetical protein
MSPIINASLQEVLAFCTSSDGEQQRRVTQVCEMCHADECEVWAAVLGRIWSETAECPGVESEHGRQLVRELNCYARVFRDYVTMQSKVYGKRIGYWEELDEHGDYVYRFAHSLLRRLAAWTVEACEWSGSPSISCVCSAAGGRGGSAPGGPEASER